jgi:uncharacterized protein YjiS (DUF1127 family)
MLGRMMTDPDLNFGDRGYDADVGQANGSGKATGSTPAPCRTLARIADLYRRWRTDRRDLADLSAMNDIELRDIGLPTFSAWRASVWLSLEVSRFTRLVRRLVSSKGRLML